MEPYEAALPHCDLAQLSAVFRCVGQPRRTLAEGTAEDVKQLLGEKSWGEKRLWLHNPGIAAAVDVISPRLDGAKECLAKWAGTARKKREQVDQRR